MGSFLPVDCQHSRYSHIRQEALKMSKNSTVNLAAVTL